MGILSNIFSKIMNVAHAATDTVSDHLSHSTESSQKTEQIPQASSNNSDSKQPVDVEAVLKNLALKADTKLNYQTSIVDLLKLLNMDSSLDSRRKLADELHYTGDKNNTESMNIWLIKQVYGKLSENGGHVPQNWKA